MTSHWLFQLAVLALLLSWLLGAYNRLKRLRGAVLQAWGQVEPALQRRSEAIGSVVEALREAMAEEAGTLQALQESDLRLRQAAAGATAARAQVEAVSQWVAAEATLASPASRLRALVDLHRPVGADGAPLPGLAAAMADWADLDARLVFARQAFNVASEAYNRAIEQFPTRLLAGLFGFRLTGRA